MAKTVVSVLTDQDLYDALVEMAVPYEALARTVWTQAVSSAFRCSHWSCKVQLPPTTGMPRIHVLGANYLKAHSLSHVNPLSISAYAEEDFPSMWIGVDLLQAYDWVVLYRGQWEPVRPIDLITLRENNPSVYGRRFKTNLCSGCGLPLVDETKMGSIGGTYLRPLKNNVVFVADDRRKYDLDCVMPLPAVMPPNIDEAIWEQLPYFAMQYNYSKQVGAPTTLYSEMRQNEKNWDDPLEARRRYEHQLFEHIIKFWKRGEV